MMSEKELAKDIAATINHLNERLVEAENAGLEVAVGITNKEMVKQNQSRFDVNLITCEITQILATV